MAAMRESARRASDRGHRWIATPARRRRDSGRPRFTEATISVISTMMRLRLPMSAKCPAGNVQKQHRILCESDEAEREEPKWVRS